MQTLYSEQSRREKDRRFGTEGSTLPEIPYTSDEIIRNLHRNPEIFAEIPVLKSRSRPLPLILTPWPWVNLQVRLVGMSTESLGVAQLNYGCGLVLHCL